MGLLRIAYPYDRFLSAAVPVPTQHMHAEDQPAPPVPDQGWGCVGCCL